LVLGRRNIFAHLLLLFVAFSALFLLFALVLEGLVGGRYVLALIVVELAPVKALVTHVVGERVLERVLRENERIFVTVQARERVLVLQKRLLIHSLLKLQFLLYCLDVVANVVVIVAVLGAQPLRQEPVLNRVLVLAEQIVELRTVVIQLAVDQF